MDFHCLQRTTLCSLYRWTVQSTSPYRFEAKRKKEWLIVFAFERKEYIHFCEFVSSAHTWLIGPSPPRSLIASVQGSRRGSS